MKTLARVMILMVALAIAVQGGDIRDVDYGPFREVNLLDDPAVNALRTYGYSGGYRYEPGRVELNGGYVVFGFEPNRVELVDGRDIYTLDNISCAYYSPWNASSASLRLAYSGGALRISISDKPRGGDWLELYTSPGGATGERRLTLPIPPSHLNTAPGNRCEFYLRVEQTGAGAVSLDAASLSWSTWGYNTSIQPNHFYSICGSPNAYSEGYRRYLELLNDLQPAAVNQHVMWNWVQPSFWPWHWVYDEDDWDGYNNYFHITNDRARFEEYEINIGARFDMARMFRFYSGVDDFNYPEPVSAANLPMIEFWIQPDIQEPARWVSFGNAAVKDLERDLKNPGKYPVWHPELIWRVTGEHGKRYNEHGTKPYFGFSMNNRFYCPLYPYTQDYWGRYRINNRVLIYKDGSREDIYYRDGDDYYFSKDRLFDRWISQDYPGTNLRLADLEERNIHLGGTKVVPILDEYVGWSEDTPVPREPCPATGDAGITPTVRHFLEYTVEELELITPAERRNYPDDSGRPYFKVGMVRDVDGVVTDTNIAGYLMTNEPGFHRGVQGHLYERSGGGWRRIQPRDHDEYYPWMNAYSPALEEHFSHWLFSYLDGEDHLSETEVWSNSGYAGGPNPLDALNLAWGTSYRPGETIPLPVRVVTLEDSAPRSTEDDFALKPEHVRFNSWERRLFDYLREGYRPGDEAYLLGGHDGVEKVSGGQLRMWYDYLRYKHHAWERYLVWAPGVFNGAFAALDGRNDVPLSDSRLGRRLLLGSEMGFHQAWNSKMGVQMDPLAYNTAAVGVNPHASTWSQFVSYLRAGQCAASSDPDDPFGYYPVYFSEYANSFVTDLGGSWRMMHSLADIAQFTQYMNLYDIRLGFWHNLLEIWADDGHYLGAPGRWNDYTYADRLYEFYSTPTYDLQLDREPRILILFDPPSIACGSNADVRGGHETLSALLIRYGYLSDTWRSFRFRELELSQTQALAERYDLIIIPDWYIMDDGSYEPFGFNELALLEAYLGHGGRVMLFDSAGLWTFDDRRQTYGQIVRRVPRQLYGGIREVYEEYYDVRAPRGFILPRLHVQRDFGYLGTYDDSLTLSNGTNMPPFTDYNNNRYEGDSDSGGLFFTHFDKDPAFAPVLEIEGYGDVQRPRNIVGTIDTSAGVTPYGNIFYSGARVFPYAGSGDGELIRKMLFTAARWAGVDNSVTLTPVLAAPNAGFENGQKPWRLVRETEDKRLAVELVEYSREGVSGYGERGLKLSFNAGGYYTSSANRPKMADQIGVEIALADLLPGQELIPGQQYHVYFDARVAAFDCPVNQNQYHQERGLLSYGGPYLGVYLKEPGGDYRLHWVTDLIAENLNESTRTVHGEWRRYDFPLVIPYPAAGKSAGETLIRLVLSGELQLLRERERIHGARHEVEWDKNQAEFANTTLYLDNVGAVNEFVNADTYDEARGGENHGHAHRLLLGKDNNVLLGVYESTVELSQGASQALLRLHVAELPEGGGSFVVRLLESPWDEDTHRRPGDVRVSDASRVVFTITHRGFHEIDITELLAHWRARGLDSYHGLHLSSEGGAGRVSISSRESWSELLRPRVILQ